MAFLTSIVVSAKFAFGIASCVATAESENPETPSVRLPPAGCAFSLPTGSALIHSPTSPPNRPSDGPQGYPKACTRGEPLDICHIRWSQEVDNDETLWLSFRKNAVEFLATAGRLVVGGRYVSASRAIAAHFVLNCDRFCAAQLADVGIAMGHGSRCTTARIRVTLRPISEDPPTAARPDGPGRRRQEGRCPELQSNRQQGLRYTGNEFFATLGKGPAGWPVPKL